MVGGDSSFGLKANAGGNGTATVNYNGGTINLMGGSFSDGIFASGSTATIKTLPGTSITVNSTSAGPKGVEAFGGDATKADVQSTILVNGNLTSPVSDFRF